MANTILIAYDLRLRDLQRSRSQLGQQLVIKPSIRCPGCDVAAAEKCSVSGLQLSVVWSVAEPDFAAFHEA